MEDPVRERAMEDPVLWLFIIFSSGMEKCLWDGLSLNCLVIMAKKATPMNSKVAGCGFSRA